jgi:zinc D-Ala-D-Ala dipeptidase
VRKLFIILVLLGIFGCESRLSEQAADAEQIDLEDLVTIGDEQFLIVDQVGDMEQSLIEAGLVDVEKVIPGIFVDLKYSTEDNFFGNDVYGELTRCYLQPVVVDMLAKALQKLKQERPDLTFLIYDGVRPLRIQQILWDNLEKPDSIKPLYVADPKIGGLHNFGVAVDLTLADAVTGEALDMGTPFDYFGYPAYPDREPQMLREGKITQQHIDNRNLLRSAMKYGGFRGIGSEWWHFNAFSRKEAGEQFSLIK